MATSPQVSPPRKKRKPRNNAVFTHDIPQWYCREIDLDTFTLEQESTVLWALVYQEWQGKKDINESKWINVTADAHRKGTGDTCCVSWCNHFHASRCPWHAEVIKDPSTMTGYVWIGNKAHAFCAIMQQERGVPSQLHIALQSPSALNKRPGQMVALLHCKGATMPRTVVRQFKQWFSRQKKKSYFTPSTR